MGGRRKEEKKRTSPGGGNTSLFIYLFFPGRREGGKKERELVVMEVGPPFSSPRFCKKARDENSLVVVRKGGSPVLPLKKQLSVKREKSKEEKKSP